MDSSSLSSSSKSASQGSFYHRNSIIGLYKLSSGNGNVIFTGDFESFLSRARSILRFAPETGDFSLTLGMIK